MKLKIYSLALVAVVGFGVIPHVYAGKDFSATEACSEGGEIGGQEITCRQVVKQVTGSGGNLKGGGFCGKVTFPHYLNKNGCGGIALDGTGEQ